MAEATLPSPLRRDSILDRPLFPAWQRITALLVHWELLLYGAFILIAFVLRIWDLGGRAMHHDESLHAYYAWQLFTGNGYKYDPLMHGPFQFEVAPIFYLLFGASEFSARLLPVVLGTIIIFVPYYLRSYITRPGALLAAFMLAISPGFVYFSRFIRDDIYLACFTLIIFVAIVRYLDEHRPMYLYVAAATAALAMASMEASYITFFIFGSFLVFEAVREYVVDVEGPVRRAAKNTSLDTWLTALAIFIVLTVLLFSTFFTNPYGIWDSSHPLCLKDCFSTHPQWNTARKDILGGVAYWFAQHSYQRGGQPWFYYLLVLPLYEQLAVLLGLAGLAYAALRRSLVTSFLAWWAVLSLVLYSWAGEKMPWLSIHITLPFIMLAALFMGAVLTQRRRVLVVFAGVAFLLLSLLEIHSTFLLNYVDAANPTELLIYVQTSQDVPHVVNEIKTLSQRPGLGGSTMPIGLDDNDVGGWPFSWYLRNFSNVTETTAFNGPTCGGRYCPVLLMLGPEFDQYSNKLMTHYVAQKYRWNWWFPEDYKDWFPQHWGNVFSGKGSLDNLIGTPTDRLHVWNWLMYRQPFGDRGARWLYFLVRRDLVPNSKLFSTRAPPSSVGIQPPTVASRFSSIPASVVSTMGSTGANNALLAGPRGIAAGPDGSLYVADTLNHRIVRYSASGKVASTWGQAGSAPGQFSANNSPLGLEVGPDGLIYVADTWNGRIEVFRPSGALVREWGGGGIGSGNGQFYGPRSLAVYGNKVFVADTGNKRIQVFSTKGRFLYTWGTTGTGPGEFNEPSSVAVGAKGQVYVADFWNQRIQEFDTRGAYLRSWIVADWTPHSYEEPYLSVDKRNGRVFATDPGTRQVIEFTSTGKALGAFGSTSLTNPIGVAVSPNGRIAVSDATANQMSVFTLGAPSARSVSGNPTGSRAKTQPPVIKATVPARFVGQIRPVKKP